MTLAREALALIEQFEGYHKARRDGRADPYLCPAHVPTIGIGSTFYEDGHKVTLLDMPITRERAYELLGHELRQCEAAVDRLTTRRLPALARGALVAFTYNVGSGAYRASGLRRAVNAGDDERARVEFLKWRLAGGVVLRGLERRRMAEAALYLKGVRYNETLARGGVVLGDGWGVTGIVHAAGGTAAGEERRTPGSAAAGGDRAPAKRAGWWSWSSHGLPESGGA